MIECIVYSVGVCDSVSVDTIFHQSIPFTITVVLLKLVLWSVVER